MCRLSPLVLLALSLVSASQPVPLTLVDSQTRLYLIPSWDLSVVLSGLQRAPFEPLESVETALLTDLTSIKRVVDLQAFSVSESCLEPGYVPKVPTTPFSDQVVNLQAIPPDEGDPALSLLCPVRFLCMYLDRTQSFRRSEQLSL